MNLPMESKTSDLPFDIVYTSPLSRARRTAEVVCEALGLTKPLVMDSLIERDFGTMTGKLASDIERVCAPDLVKTETITYFLSPPGAETFPDLLKRAGRTLDQIHAEQQSGTFSPPFPFKRLKMKMGTVMIFTNSSSRGIKSE